MKWSGIAALAPYFYVSRLLGLTPILAKRKRGGSLEFAAHRILLVISVMHTSVIACIGYFASISLAELIENSSPLILHNASVVLSCYGAVILLGTAFFYRHHTVRAFNEIHQLSHLLMGHSDHNQVPYEAFFTAFSYIYITTRCISLIYGFENFAKELVEYHYSYLVHFSSYSFATGSLFYLGSFFECLNSALSEIGLKPSAIRTEMETLLILQHLRQLRKVHNRICNLCDLICERSSLDIFIILAVIIYILLAEFYSDAWDKGSNLPVLLVVSNMLHYVFLCLQLAHICRRSDYVMKQSEETSTKVQSLMTAYLPAGIKQEIYHFTLQTMLRKVEITACGFYGLRTETITTLAYLITTYTVLVINLAQVM